ncbi:phage tail tip lysozyme [Rhizobium leguminosarum]|uniref:phage tail tip lysozyme n=1 Tax=Rhizobium leguminosarum TaxID=384 RepID=UPI001441C03F|nr:phage tail tip lysozyme [Rhizobium leguminosarum]
MGFIFGGDTGQSQESVTDARKRLAAAMLQQGTDTSPIQSPWEGAARMAQALMGGLAVRKQGELQSAADAQLISAITGQPYTPPEKPAGFLSSIFGGSKAANPGATGSSMPSADPGGNIPPTKLTDNDVSSGFIDTVKSGYDADGQKLAVTNPYGLAAIAATGQAESGFSPANVGRTWNDGANDAGGIMSWNGPRLANLQKFAGGTNGTPQQQAQFFLQENPGLIAKLNNAKSVAEAQQIMNNAWAFKGYDQPGNPNAAHRLSLANSYLPRFQGATAGAEEASLDLPASPIQPSPDNPPAPAPQSGYTDPMLAPRPDAPPMPQAGTHGEVASLDPSIGIPMPGAAGQMRASAPAQPMPPQGVPRAALSPLPTSTVGPTPNVASVPPVDQQQPGPARLAQALNGASPQQAANPMADPRAQALVKAIMNPNASPQVKAMAAQSLQTLMKPPEYGFQVLPDGTVLRTDPRTGTFSPVYRSEMSPADQAKLDFEREKFRQEQANRNTLTAKDEADVDLNRDKFDFEKNKPMVVQPGETLFSPGQERVVYQGTGYKPEDVSNLRKEIQGLPTYKSYQQALPPYQSMVDTAKTDSKASDLNLVYGLGKIMDPNSVVREGEMVMVNNTSSLPDWLQGAINSVNGGSRLEPATRTAILNEARSRMTAYRGALDNDISQYRGIIGRRGMNEADVLPTLGDIPEVPSLTPPAADVGAPPEGVPADVWGEMTPAERKLWQK